MLARLRAARRDDRGFTLIELLVVMIIIGVLAAVAVPVFLHQRQKAVDASIKSDLHSSAIEVQTLQEDLVTEMAFAVSYGGYINLGDPWVTPYLQAAGLHLTVTGQNALALKVRADGSYCLQGSSPKGTATGGTGSTAKFFIYDSAQGGLQAGAPRADDGHGC